MERAPLVGMPRWRFSGLPLVKLSVVEGAAGGVDPPAIADVVAASGVIVIAHLDLWLVAGAGVHDHDVSAGPGIDHDHIAVVAITVIIVNPSVARIAIADFALHVGGAADRAIVHEDSFATAVQ